MWKDFTLHGHIARSKGRGIAIFVFPGTDGYHLLAVESKLDADVGKVFDDHAHADLGVFKSMEAATKATKAFVRKWRRKIALKKCDCGEIVGTP